MKAKAIEADSVQSRVVNLASLQNNITIKSMKDSMRDSFADLYGGELTLIQPANNEETEKLYNQYSSWDWRYGETPEFDVSLRKRFTWGEIDMGLSVEEGKITEATIYSDAMDCSIIESLQHLLPGIPFKYDDIKQRINTNIAPKSPEIAGDINDWLELTLNK
jgi:lipoate-protein ligase A